MTESSSQDNQGDTDSAWVAIETPFDAKWLSGFLDDVERLFRINSLLVFENWQSLGNGEYQFEANNLSNEKTVKTRLKTVREGDTLTVTYSEGLKTTTTFRVEPKPDGTADLIVTDDYSGTSADERKARIDEVDKSLVQWGRDLHLYLLMWKKWGWVPGWKWYMCRVWQPMRPMARRICYMLMMITMLEFIAFLMVFTIFWLELDKYLE
ncbi:MAG: hypothetical protein CMM60_06415 [Rhodospirillaceae bacterium]|jgi:hypothetical protein|nr:hypothetical protein [Rhodospirillaceae bacterium]|tara:strand:+ start:123 stop:749 length:627 start_codon:yes stop_codon:yes gene_type:complete